LDDNKKKEKEEKGDMEGRRRGDATVPFGRFSKKKEQIESKDDIGKRRGPQTKRKISSQTRKKKQAMQTSIIQTS